MTTAKVQSLSAFAWSIAEILRGDFKQSEYGKVVLPFVVLRRLDCLLESTKSAVLKAYESLPNGIDDQIKDMMLYGAVGSNLKLYNYSQLTFRKIHGQDPADVHKNLLDYITKFNTSVRDIFLEKFLFTDQLKRLKDGGILWQVFDRFSQIDLHPDRVSNIEMGYLFEDLIRKFSEISNETAGEHFTPREVIRLIVDLLLINDVEALAGSGIIRTVYDPACGTGGMLAMMEEAMKGFNSKIRVELYGQELNPESFGICKSDMLITGHNPDQIAFGNTLTEDAHRDKKFHYMLSNPPYGVDWKKYQEPIVEEYKTLGKKGRFGAGLPRVSDGQLLFLQHMISKMRDDTAGSRIGIVMNGSPLFTGGAGSGESEIRRWMFENDWVEAIIALPTDLFYNTGIQTYVWMLTNKKDEKRRGKVQLIDASSDRFWQSMRKSLGSKRREIPEIARQEVVKLYNEMLNGNSGWGEYSKIFDKEDFGYREIRIERPLRLNFQFSLERIELLKNDKNFLKLSLTEKEELVRILSTNISSDIFKNRYVFEKVLSKVLKKTVIHISSSLKKAIISVLSEKDDMAEICVDAKGNIEADSDLRDHELVPIKESWRDYIEREVMPYVPDIWVDENYKDPSDGGVGRVGYEINFNRYFYKYISPRPVKEIDDELRAIEAEISNLLKEVAL
ncbi:class I SAM-dependent DNA methyltransferase [Emticicia sp. BO119]|uniref:type I restriction-modification system subunit M n=1 Tax=Emticicia sp. BO119 TaxID=2757768 RepID=UPI0015F011DD|nr:class I SAM-dependent DNA methyltransferase [Emticicia sp. BO119]MBA4853467.1 SAM-dependent DNA methyltransferase [Emticicia sp. BO119]